MFTSHRKDRLAFIQIWLTLAICLVLQPTAKPQTGSTDVDGVQLARQAIRDLLARNHSPVEQLQISLIGKPTLPPEHRRLHRSSIRVEDGASAIVGRIFDENWKPMAGVKVLALPNDMAAKQPPTALSDTLGVFQITDLPPGSQKVRVEASGLGPFETKLQLASGVHHVLASLSGSGRLYTLLDSRGSLPTLLQLATSRGDRILQFHNVQTEANRVKEIHSIHSIPPEVQNEAPHLSDSEATATAHELTSFFEAWVDVTRGSERFKSFFATKVDCRLYISGTQFLKSVDPQLCVSMLLEEVAYRAWIELEGGFVYSPLFNSTPGLTDAERIQNTRAFLEVAKGVFRDAGMLDAQHLRAVSPYLRRKLDRGFFKGILDPGESEPGALSGLAYIYEVHQDCYITFGRERDALRLLGAFCGAG
jgi:carboxypeptidase family protein